MSIVEPLTDAEIEAMRKAGLLECRCPNPIPEPVWGSFQCTRCYRKIPGT
jgi:hypothetical protein